jgi:hypothetical protein
LCPEALAKWQIDDGTKLPILQKKIEERWVEIRARPPVEIN